MKDPSQSRQIAVHRRGLDLIVLAMHHKSGNRLVCYLIDGKRGDPGIRLEIGDSVFIRADCVRLCGRGRSDKGEEQFVGKTGERGQRFVVSDAGLTTRERRLVRGLDTDGAFAAPPVTSLRKLQAASFQFELHGDEEEHAEYEKWLAMLFAPGTSLGGARPKASIRDEAGALCLAKFPSRQDRRDVGAWERVAHRQAGAPHLVVGSDAM